MLTHIATVATAGLLFSACGPAVSASATSPDGAANAAQASIETTPILDSVLCKRARGKTSYDIEQVSKSGVVNISGWNVRFRDQKWQAEHPTNAKLTMDFYSNSWLTPSTVKDIPFAVDLVLDQARSNPDRGSRFMKDGWSEAVTTKRLQSVACLYSLAGDPRLIPVVEELAAANMDESRYYGPPNHKAHNHGVMADRALIDASNVMGRPEWRDKAVQRLRAQLAGTFDSCGMIHEQSSTYQNFQSSLWRHVSNRTRGIPVSEDMSEAADRARGMVEALANPDGSFEIIGDGSFLEVEKKGPVRSVNHWCPDTGWAVSTTVDKRLVQHEIIRFGSGTRFHGHPDKGSMTWWVGNHDRVGKRVLTDRGLYGKNNDWRLVYSRSSEAQSTLLWQGGSDLRMQGKQSRVGDARVVKLSGSNKRGAWDRKITRFDSTARTVFEDTVRGAAASRGATQVFTLAPGWNATKRSGEFRTSDGWRLTVSCSASSGPVAVENRRVEHYPSRGVIERAISVHCKAPGASQAVSLKADLRVSAPQGAGI